MDGEREWKIELGRVSLYWLRLDSLDFESHSIGQNSSMQPYLPSREIGTSSLIYMSRRKRGTSSMNN